MSPALTNGEHGHVRFIPLTYDSQDSQNSALKLIYTLLPEWTSEDSNVEFVRFTDGITNTLLKAINRRPGLTKEDIDREAVLLRAYGNGTAILIDREREAENHELLMKYKLAPELMARFNNGMLYRFVPGTVAHAGNLSEPEILRAIARRLAQWHATVPCLPDAHPHKRGGINGTNGVNGINGTNGHKETNGVNGHNGTNGHTNGDHGRSQQDMIDNAAPGKPPPNVWTIMQKWIFALPTETEAQRERQALLQRELEEMVEKLSRRPGLGENGVCMETPRPCQLG